ncbi:protein virilizer homolog isoform X2 [Amaranthus tricolor]|uniref:protein virilizer homolog isoform X2 n=1 Tax=Amaranthus tricolor TaxID=29722 RepID=UPI00258F59A6|nr:protein virilizer homolog isoform X2 [Amaranthus tricolor]
MGRPEPCVLFAQTFVHPQLDEYVDEVIFAEPIVITACEFLEQNASSALSTVALLGVTSPPSFALEVFVQCEGEARFRRLCQPFLYSHSSSNVLEVEAVVTNHLVVRGSYRSLSLVVYGNTAEDLGQFNVEFDLDNSVVNLVSSSEAKLEDLPPLLHSRSLKLEDSISSLKALSSVLPATDISLEMRRLLQLAFKMLDIPNFGVFREKVLTIITSATASFFTNDLNSSGITLQELNWGAVADSKEPFFVFTKAKNDLLELCKSYMESGHICGDFLEECSFLESKTDLATAKELVDTFFQHFKFNKDIPYVAHPHLSKSNNVLFWLSLSLILCSGKESCFHYVNGGGMEQLTHFLSHKVQNSTSVILMILGVVEQATRYSVGCEGFLGWWPHEGEDVPSNVSEGYSQLLKLLMQKQRHDIAALATYILHRLRFYEVASKYEYAVLSIVGGLSGDVHATTTTSSMLVNAKLQIRKLLKLIKSSGWVEDPSPVAGAIQSLMVASSEAVLSFKATSKLIASSSCRFLHQKIDAKLLALLKERGFLPLSVALMSSSELWSERGHALQAVLDVTSSIEATLLSLMFCRSGLVFLLQHPDLSSTIIHAFKGDDDVNDFIPLRYASVLISKGFFCRLRDIGINLEMHLRVVNNVDRLLTATPCSEELLWILWELCGLSRSDGGRQALLAFTHFPEAITILIEALHSAKELESISLTCGTPLNLAIFHAAAEICEIIVTDSASSSMSVWINHVTDLHKAVHSSSPGSSRKDAPSRLLEWIDAGVVYHKNGAVGLLRYAAVLASGGDAHITSTNILVSDTMDVENVVGDSSSESDVNVVESLLGKLVTDKSFDGVTLRDSSVAQLITAMRILAQISENADVAASLFDEGAMTVIYVILVNSRLMLERFSNNYDYLVDDGVECSSTSDLLLERNREKYLIDLLIPSLLLLLELLQRLKEAKEQLRNTKLMNVLLRLHRELSPKLAACAVDLSSSYPDSALGLETVCHLIVSALACWPAYAWTPGLFHTLLDSVQAASLLTLGPKETCSMLCLLIDLFPDEGVWHWKNGMPLLTPARALAVGTLLGPLEETKVNWYLEHPYVEVLLVQLSPHLDKIAQVVLHYAVSTMVVVQDMLRVLILRIARQRSEYAIVLLHPIISWIQNHLIENSPDEIDAYKGSKLLEFVSLLLEHPTAKPLLLKAGTLHILTKVLEGINSHVKPGSSIYNCCVPALRSLSMICDSLSAQLPHKLLDGNWTLTTEDSTIILNNVFKLFQNLPVGNELLACLATFKGLVTHAEGQRALLDAFQFIKSRNIWENQPGRVQDSHGFYGRLIDAEWKRCPLLCCWIKLYQFIENEGLSTFSVEAVGELSSGALRFCIDGKSFNQDRIEALKYFFGLLCGIDEMSAIPEENMNYVQDMYTLLSSKIPDEECSALTHLKTTLYQVVESARCLSLLLLQPIGSLKVDEIIPKEVVLFSSDVKLSSKIRLLTDSSSKRVENEWNVGELGDKFLWECPENLRNRLSEAGLLGKRKMSTADGSNRHGKGENSLVDTRSGSSVVPPIPTRRDTFRLRKPNTSRPPSMHVDDYVARERNADGVTNPNVIAVPRLGSSSGRAPSIHVDEFMARQRDRQSAVAMAGVEAVSQEKKVAPENNETEKSKRSKQLKVELDDDLQGIDIVFDAEENEPDDKLPFPQADDDERSPQHSIVEETESDAKDLEATVASNVDDKTQSELSSRMSVSRPAVPLRREPSVSSENKFFDQTDEVRNKNTVIMSGGSDSATVVKTSAVSTLTFVRDSSSMIHVQADSRTPHPSFMPDNNLPRAGNVPLGRPQSHHEQKHFANQPPLPPTPPPSTISPVRSQVSEPNPASTSSYVNSHTDMQPPLYPNPAQTDYQSYGNAPTSTPNFIMDPRYVRASHSSPGGSTRFFPPLPPTPPPFSAALLNVSSRSPTSQSSGYAQNNTGVTEVSQYGPPPLIPAGFSRPASMPFNMHGNVPVQQNENMTGMAQNSHAPQPPMQPMQPPHLQPLQAPQLPCPQLPQQLRPIMQSSQHTDQNVSISHNVQPPQIMQQSQMSPYHLYHQTQLQENSPHSQRQLQAAVPQTDAATQQQADSSMSLQQYFSSPEAIQSLLSDRDKLCKLLEQHPKLMQMLQERLGHL